MNGEEFCVINTELDGEGCPPGVCDEDKDWT